MHLPIKAFCLKGSTGNEKIEIIIEDIFGFPHETCYDGGYDFRGIANVHIGNFKVNDAPVFCSTGALYRLLMSLKQCYQSLEGTASLFHSLENNLTFVLSMTKLGHAVIEGEYQEISHVNTKLVFEMETDQTCILSTINELQTIENLFGNEFGKRSE